MPGPGDLIYLNSCLPWCQEILQLVMQQISPHTAVLLEKSKRYDSHNVGIKKSPLRG